MLQDAEGDQGHDALAVGRNLVDGVAAVVGVDRAHPVGAVRGEVAGAHDATVGSRVCLEFCRELSAVEGFSLCCRDLLQGGRMVGKGEQFAGFRGPPMRQERVGEPGLGFEQRNLRGPLSGYRR